MKTIIIIPCYNEEKSIKKTYDSIITYNKKNKTKLDVIVVNDGSTDQSLSVLQNNNIPHLNLPINLGIGGAMQAGYKYAYRHGYDIAIQFDGDGQHNINSISNLIRPIEDNKADMVIGSRFVNKKNKANFKTSFMRRIGIRLISFEIFIFAHKKVYDTTSGYRAVNRKVMEKFVRFYPYEYPEPITNLTILKSKYKVKEVEALMRERENGKSSITIIKSAYYMLNVLIYIFILGWRKN